MTEDIHIRNFMGDFIQHCASSAAPQIPLFRRIEPRTVSSASALAVRRVNHSARSCPPTRLDVIIKRLEIKPETNMSLPVIEPVASAVGGE
jgi:hypothetical protein